MLLDTNNSKTFQDFKKKIKIIFKNNKSRYKVVNTVYAKVFKNNEKEENLKEKEKIRWEDCLEDDGRNQNSPISNFCEKPLSKSVIALTTRFRKIIGYESEIIEKCENNFSSNQKSYEKYILFAFFLIEHSDGDILPKNEDIDKLFDVTEWERKNLKKKLLEIKFLIKVGYNKFLINKDHELFLEYQQNNK